MKRQLFFQSASPPIVASLTQQLPAQCSWPPNVACRAPVVVQQVPPRAFASARQRRAVASRSARSAGGRARSVSNVRGRRSAAELAWFGHHSGASRRCPAQPKWRLCTPPPHCGGGSPAPLSSVGGGSTRSLRPALWCLSAPTARCRPTPRCSGRHPGDLSNILVSGVDLPWLRSALLAGCRR